MIWPALYVTAILFAARGANKNPAEGAASVAGQRGHVASARKKAAELEAKRSRLTIAVSPGAEVAGLEIRCDGETLPENQWGVAVSRDGGGHDVQATAPGKNLWSTHVELKPSGPSLVITVPPLDPAKAPSPPAQAPAPAESAPAAAVAQTPITDEESHPGRTQRWIGLLVGGAGLVGVGVGGAVALMAKSQMNTAQTEPNPAAHNDSASAVNSGNMATVLVGAGAAVALAGAIVWLAAPSAPVAVGTNGGALFVRGTF